MDNRTWLSSMRRNQSYFSGYSNYTAPTTWTTPNINISVGQNPKASGFLQGSRNAWNKSFGKDASVGTKASSAAAALGAIGTMANGAMNLATPSGNTDSIKDTARSLNSLRLTNASLDTISNFESNWRPMKTDYTWKDFYGLGGCIPHRFDAGGRAFSGILSNTGTGAATGAQIGGGWGALVGGAIGLGSGLFGYFSGKHKAKGYANEGNQIGEDTNENIEGMINLGYNNAKHRQTLGLETSTPYAYGGILDGYDDGVGAIGYGFMNDYLTMRNSQAQAKNSVSNPYFSNLGINNTTMFKDGGGIHIDPSKKGTYEAAARARGISMPELTDRIKANPENYPPSLRKKATFYDNFARHKKSDGGNLIIGSNGDTLFALGGVMQANGGDYSTGLTHISAGQSHEENPYGGVQFGIAPDGAPNLVEQNETIYDDYVYSDRIAMDEQALKAMHMYSKGGKLTYAKASKKLEKEAEERTNDPISRASLKDMLHKLADEQERQKAEEEAKRARAAFEALSPEEQAAVMQQVAEQQAAEEQQAEDAANAEVQSQPAPEDIAMQQQAEQQEPIQQDAAMQQQMAAQQAAQEAAISAYGGKIGHKFALGDELTFQDRLYNALGFNVDSDWNKWYNDNKLGDAIDWDTFDLKQLKGNTALMDAIRKKNPALADAIQNRGYDLGAYTYNPQDNAIVDINTANWSTARKGGSSWANSKDPIWQQAINKYWQSHDNLESVDDVVKAINRLSLNDFQNLLMSTDAYQKTNEALKDDANSLMYLNTILNNPEAPENAKRWARNFVDENTGTWRAGKAHTFADVYGADGKGVRMTDPGTYWHTFMPALANENTANYLINDDDTVELIRGNDLSGYDAAGNYTFDVLGDDGINTNNRINYYRRKAAADAATGANGTGAAATGDANGDAGNGTERYLPYKSDSWRYAGIFGPAANLGLMAAGVGRPNYSDYDKVMELADEANNDVLVDWRPIGNYMRYQPWDVWDSRNRADASSRATARAIVNNNASTGAKYMGLIANENNSLANAANLDKTRREYNNSLFNQALTFNRDTDKFNAEAYNRTALTRAEMQNKNRQFKASLAADIARQKADTRASWYNSLYGNVSGIFNNLANMGRENASWNRYAALANMGTFGTLGSEMGKLSGDKNGKVLTTTPTTTSTPTTTPSAATTSYVGLAPVQPQYSFDGVLLDPSYMVSTDPYKDLRRSRSKGGKVSRKKNSKRRGLTY